MMDERLCSLFSSIIARKGKVHLVGIKGVGMTALAEILCQRGVEITGSDVADVFYTDQVLASVGIGVSSPFDSANVPVGVDAVVHSSAYGRETNPELVRAAALGIPVLLYTEALGALSRTMFSCGISGVHGKTTTTALSGTLMASLGLEATVLAGSAVSDFGNRSTLVRGNRYFIAETCEYRRHFMDFRPSKIVLTSVESDHQDFFPTYRDIFLAFTDYVGLLPPGGELIYCADDPGAREAALAMAKTRPDIAFTSYGEQADGKYRISGYRSGNGETRFSLPAFESEILLKVPGKHVALDATAAIALASSLVVLDRGSFSDDDEKSVVRSLGEFRGSKRRSEILGERNGILFMDDYAHHPTAISLTLKGLREFHSGRRIVVDFMAHTYSRTKALFREFSESFADADIVLLHRIYPSARETPDPSVDGRMLFEETVRHAKHAEYFDEPMDALPWLEKELAPGDLFITMGAGDNWKLGVELMGKMPSEGGKGQA